MIIALWRWILLPNLDVINLCTFFVGFISRFLAICGNDPRQIVRMAGQSSLFWPSCQSMTMEHTTFTTKIPPTTLIVVTFWWNHSSALAMLSRVDRWMDWKHADLGSDNGANVCGVPAWTVDNVIWPCLHGFWGEKESISDLEVDSIEKDEQMSWDLKKWRLFLKLKRECWGYLWWSTTLSCWN